MSELGQAEEQLVKAAAYFGRVIREHGQRYLACRVDGVTFVAAIDDDAQKLEDAVVVGELFGKGAVMRGPKPKPLAVLIPLYHAPSDEFANKLGHVHLHVLHDAKLGRRVRKSGECLCSKKRGSRQQTPPDGVTHTVCTECKHVADEFGLEWTLA